MTVKITKNYRLSRIIELIKIGTYQVSGFTKGKTTQKKPAARPPAKPEVIQVQNRADQTLQFSETMSQRALLQSIPGAAIQLKGIPTNIRCRQFTTIISERLFIKAEKYGIAIDISPQFNQIKGPREFRSTYTSVKFGFTEAVTNRLTNNNRMAKITDRISGGGLTRLSTVKKFNSRTSVASLLQKQPPTLNRIDPSTTKTKIPVPPTHLQTDTTRKSDTPQPPPKGVPNSDLLSFEKMEVQSNSVTKPDINKLPKTPPKIATQPDTKAAPKG
ncbi:hypothetical protein PGT21_037247 [Puccinia graminis f. sp. tritici]|uniref:Uncharacterized protein n=1 Tax=Puccinia graminis f. sp. tritici TaxID=56615 RepID=A0A5B0R413_PUCGR|nr:hypothetical protein PGTUg99_019320 [Puccinia graminis f. sp. tritici]KAA1120190.1 hypothetical protein PGT21_037247 [Puccinia graminis f. sp. tritici]